MAGPAIGGYTDVGKIRAVTGLTDNEVDDTTLQSMELDTALSADLYGWLSDPAAIKTAGTAGSPSAEDTQKWNLLQLYATNFCALKTLESSLHIPLQKTNGKDAFKRFSDKTLAEAIETLRRRVGDYRTQLEQIIAPVSATGSGLFALAKPDYDPVTNT